MGNEAQYQLSERARVQDGVFSKDDALGAGFTESAIKDHLERRRWDVCYDNVYRFPGAPVTWRSELRAAQIAAGPLAVISHRSGAWIYELPGRRADLIELSCRRWRRSKK